MTCAQPRLSRANKVPQPAPDAIPDDGRSDVLRRNEPGAERVFVLQLERAEDEKLSALRGPLPFHSRKLRR